MGSHIGRRKFLATLGGVVAAWPLAGRAQQPAMPVIGFLRDTSLVDATHLMAAFRQGLKEAGFIEGQNVAIEYRSAEDQPHRLPALVADLVRQQVALIVGNIASALAAKTATRTIPIVFVTGYDPVINGLVDEGFRITHLDEGTDTSPDMRAMPGSWDHFNAIVPPWLLFWAVREA